MSERSGKCYTKFAPYVFFALVIIDYTVMPLSYIALNLYSMNTHNFDFKHSYYASWFVFYMIVSCSKIFDFIFVIKSVFLKDAYHYWVVDSKIKSLDDQQRRQLLAHDSKAVLDTDDFSPEVRQSVEHILKTIRSVKGPYNKQKRRYGEGERRLGQHLELEKGIYSFAFFLQMNDDKLAEHIDLLSGKLIHHSADSSSDEFEGEEEEKKHEPSHIEMQAVNH